VIKFSIDKKQKEHNEEGQPWYDTKEGILNSLKSFPDLVQMIEERHTAGYCRNERLNQFYVLGRYWLDSCGNCCKAQGFIPKEQFADIPDVLTKDEFWDFIKKHQEDKELMISFVLQSDMPLPNITCPVCGKGWDIQNCHDTVVWHKTDAISLTDFVGKTLGQVKQHYNQLTNAIYRMQSDILIRNDRFIDLSPKYPKPEHDWQKRIVKNQNGWVSEKDGITDDYVIQKGDEGFFNIWAYYHGVCNREHLEKTEEQEFRKIFEKAGFQDIRMSAILNQYCGCDHCAPWFNVNTEFGTITIGWRKRVINIDWSKVEEASQACGEFPKPNIISLFADEDVTKGQAYIHAWGWEKAQDYLSRIHSHLAS